MKYTQGETMELYGSTYLVERVYSPSPGFLAKHNLLCSTRVTLKKIRGENGLDEYDFGISNQD